MAKHDVLFSIPKRSLGKADVELEVQQDRTTLGTLAVSKGSLVWFPRGTTYGYKMEWSKFHKVMEDEATRVEKR